MSPIKNTFDDILDANISNIFRRINTAKFISIQCLLIQQILLYYSNQIMCCSFIGNLVLYSEMALEELGSRENSGINDGFGLGYHIRSRKKTKEETATGLPLLKPQKS